MNINEKYINRCIQLAQNGLGTTYPNPLVGSVIVHNNVIIGEGWHKKSGEPHAEVNAIQSVRDTSLLENATIYVSLEPCSHFGKTPPCCDLIIKNKIPNVVIGTVDPNIKVAGNGIKKLLEAGINVKVGVLEKDCLELNKRFFTFHEKKRPYIILKWAESQDGFIAPKERFEQKPVWITNPYSRQLVHKWRTEEQAILVGTQTVIDDNPTLNARDWYGKNPIRLALDQNNRIQNDSAIFDNQAQTVVFSSAKNKETPVHIIEKTIDFKENIAPQIVQTLYEMDIQSVIIEGGQRTLQTFIEEQLWDEARIFIGDKPLYNEIKAPQINRTAVQKKHLLTDELILIKNHD
ncbi:bifunctional diaminohydroxyphosphoribosylaminopyrimidine deaminase/5-amino-6-(5-phosphoribosylamino)uracil reductase RibD [Flavobacterium sp. SOK18b]|uniref:bifunctional diaminohydroxyphosphoribosylaminopyrimidine deaminase/5-amino-6-(5-phosphoribosylamino)uracil reductase RibD n=1 Tax=Flavobacterium sp. SOK18b TaxID=797900 RepID=UPI0015FA6BCD|nr:bifunctional diaminohydroxyphosphoribosylaminopyrimidine deaminase/5-amino-6-(5-phosphoribosylamino)uracil reductase RibD [Flavobacterium sp. SOK18b]